MAKAKNRTPNKTLTIPVEDLKRIEKVQSRGRLECDMSLNDSEVVRVGVRTLLELPKEGFEQAVKKLKRLRRGREKKKASRSS